MPMRSCCLGCLDGYNVTPVYYTVLYVKKNIRFGPTYHNKQIRNIIHIVQIFEKKKSAEIYLAVLMYKKAEGLLPKSSCGPPNNYSGLMEISLSVQSSSSASSPLTEDNDVQLNSLLDHFEAFRKCSCSMICFIDLQILTNFIFPVDGCPMFLAVNS